MRACHPTIMANSMMILTIGASIFSAVIAGIIAVQMQASATEMLDDAALESKQEEEKENAVLDLANSAPEVKALIDKGQMVNTDVVMGNRTHIVTKSLTQAGIVITGDYKTGYTLTFPGSQEITSTIENGEIVSTTTTEPKDHVETYSYTAKQIAVIEVGLTDEVTNAYLAAHQGDNILIGAMSQATGGGVYDCPKGGCMIVVVQNFDNRDLITTLINPETMEILHTSGVQPDIPMNDADGQ
jgi:hypothetical protein